jgi:hypothetical protein
MKNLLTTGVSALALAAALASNAYAGGGVFDALDPCIKARDAFRDQRAGIVQQLDRSIADADHADAPGQYRDAWMKAKKAQVRPTFDKLVAPELKSMGQQDMEKAYDGWFDRQLAEMGHDGVEKLLTEDFHADLKQVRLEQRAKAQAEIQSAKNDLDKSCKSDVGNQAMRGTLTIVLAPIGMISRNLEIAKNERGAIAAGLAAGSSISIDAIEKNGGVFGGDSPAAQTAFSGRTWASASDVARHSAPSLVFLTHGCQNVADRRIGDISNFCRLKNCRTAQHGLLVVAKRPPIARHPPFAQRKIGKQELKTR